jgi:hypothetical protein
MRRLIAANTIARNWIVLLCRHWQPTVVEDRVITMGFQVVRTFVFTHEKSRSAGPSEEACRLDEPCADYLSGHSR